MVNAFNLQKNETFLNFFPIFNLSLILLKKTITQEYDELFKMIYC